MKLAKKYQVIRADWIREAIRRMIDGVEGPGDWAAIYLAQISTEIREHCTREALQGEDGETVQEFLEWFRMLYNTGAYQGERNE